MCVNSWRLLNDLDTMRAEKQFISQEYITRLNASPFFIVVDYKGLTVGHFTELRKRLNKSGSQLHVVKNSIFRIAAEQAGVAKLEGTLVGQVAVVTGDRDISAAAKTLKTFKSEFEKPSIKFGHMNNQRLEMADLLALADLPSIEVLRGKLMGVLQAPAGQLVRLLNEPASSLARILKAKAEKA
jgi:large subunit ribosomal protein L10